MPSADTDCSARFWVLWPVGLGVASLLELVILSAMNTSPRIFRGSSAVREEEKFQHPLQLRELNYQFVPL